MSTVEPFYKGHTLERPCLTSGYHYWFTLTLFLPNVPLYKSHVSTVATLASHHGQSLWRGSTVVLLKNSNSLIKWSNSLLFTAHSWCKCRPVWFRWQRSVTRGRYVSEARYSDVIVASRLGLWCHQSRQFCDVDAWTWYRTTQRSRRHGCLVSATSPQSEATQTSVSL